MADDTQLIVRIAADTGSAQTEVSAVAEALARLERAFVAYGSASTTASDAVKTAHEAAAQSATSNVEAEDRLSSAHKASGRAATEHAAAEGVLGVSFEHAEMAANSAARAFGALGFQTGEATERIETLGLALESLGAAAPEMLIIGAATLTVAAAFGFLSEGIRDAAKEAATLSQIQRAVTAQGEAWDETREKVEAFTNALRESSTFASGEILDAFNAFVQRGLTAAQAMEATAAAAKLAAAENLHLGDAVSILTSGLASHIAQLERYDPALKALIDRHASLHEIVLKVAHDFDGSLAASLDNVQGKSQNLVNETADLGKHFGDLTSGPMYGFVAVLDTIITKLDEASDAMSKYLAKEDSVSSTPDELAANQAAFAAAINKPSQPMVSDKPRETNGGPYNAPTGRQHDGSDHEAEEQIRRRIEMISELYRTNRMTYPEAVRQESELRDQYKLTAAEAYELQMAELRLQDQRNEKDKRATSASDRAGRSEARIEAKPKFDFEPNLVSGVTGRSEDASAEKTLESNLHDIDAAQRLAKDSIDDTAGSLSTYATRINVASEQTNLAKTAIALLSSALAQERSEQNQLAPVLDRQTAAYETAKAKWLAFGDLLENTHPTAIQIAQLEELNKKQEQLKARADASSATMDTLSGYVDRNSEALARYNEQLAKTPNLMGDLDREMTKSRDLWAKFVVDQTAAYQKSLEPDQELKDQEATYKKSDALQIAYYERQQALLNRNDVTQEAEYQRYAEKIRNLQLDGFKKDEDDKAAFNDRALSVESTFIDDVIGKHKSLRDSLKDVWSDILSDYVQMLEQMILKSSLLGGVNKEIASIFGATGSSGGVASLFSGSSNSSGAGVADMANASFGGWGDAATDTPGSNLVVEVSSATTSKLTNGLSGTSPSYVTGAAKLLGGAAAGAGIGGVVSSISGGNAEGSSIGGALGGLLGVALHANPLIGAGIDVVSSLLGGLFGNHDDPAKMPDKYDTQNYGQGVADLTGKEAGANGQSFYTQQAVSTATGGTGEISYIEEALANGKKNSDGSFTLANGTVLNPSQYQQYLSTFGASATGSGQLQFGKDIGQQWITGANGASSSAQSYTSIDSLAKEFLSMSGGGTADSAIPVFSISRSYPDMQKASLNANGTYNEATGAYTGAAASTATQPEAAISVNITGNTTIAGAGGMKEFGATIVDAVSQAMQRRNSGQLPGGLRANPLRRRFGNV